MNVKARALLALSYIRVALIVFFVAVLPGGLFLHVQAERYASENLRQNRDACEAVNVVRGTVDDVLRTASLRARSQGAPAFAREYEEYRRKLHAVPNTPVGSAEVECDKAYR